MNPFLPMEMSALESALSQFEKVSVYVSSVVVLIATAKITFLAITISPSEKYGAVLREIVLYFAVIGLFPLLMKALIQTTGELALRLNFEPQELESGTLASYFKSLETSVPALIIFSELGKLSILHIARAIYTVLISLLIAVGPVICLTSIMVSGSGVGSYVVALVTLALWPVTWNLLGALSGEIHRSMTMTSLGQFFFWNVVELLQLSSPIFSSFLLKSLSAGEAFSRPMLVFSKGATVVNGARAFTAGTRRAGARTKR